MNVRKLTATDLERCMEIYASAKQYMVASGNPDQWNGAYPDIETLKNDIRLQRLYGVEDNDEIIAVFVLWFGGEPTYGIIDGAWLRQGSYPFGVIHRIASAAHGKGIGDFCMTWCENEALKQGVHSMRIDTHEANKPMQRCTLKNGYTYCGIIKLTNGEPRLAYEKLI